MLKKVYYRPWYEDYFGEGTKEITVYLDRFNRIFLIPNNNIELPQNHNCDAMGCGSVGPHIVAVFLLADNKNLCADSCPFKTFKDACYDPPRAGRDAKCNTS